MGFTYAQPHVIVAQVDIPELSVVTFNGNIADSTKLVGFWRVAGITPEAVRKDFVINPITDVELVNPHWSWGTNKEVYLNGKQLSHTPPVSGFIQIIGIATSAKTMLVKLSEPMIL